MGPSQPASPPDSQPNITVIVVVHVSRTQGIEDLFKRVAYQAPNTSEAYPVDEGAFG